MDIVHKSVVALKKASKKLTNVLDLDPLIAELSGWRVVLLGEASHGTHEYYTWGAAISKRLIQEQGFNCIAVEGDWPNFYCVNRYVKYYNKSHSCSVEVLKQFNRWPTRMWANWEMETLINWLYVHNGKLPPMEG